MCLILYYYPTYMLECNFVAQHIRKYLRDLLPLISVLWSSFTLPAPARPTLGYPVCVAAFSFWVEQPRDFIFLWLTIYLFS